MAVRQRARHKAPGRKTHGKTKPAGAARKGKSKPAAKKAARAKRKAAHADPLTAILDFSPTGVAISHWGESRTIYVNPAMAALMAISPDAVRGKPAVDFYADPADREKIRKALEAKGEVRRYAVRTRTAKGIARSSVLSCRLIMYEGERAVLTWLEDETERDQRELAIRSASRQVELLHQVAGIGNRAVNFYDALRKGAAEIARCIGWPVGVAYRLAHGDDQLLELSSISMPKDSPGFESLRKNLMGRSFSAGEDLPGRVLATREIAWIENVAADKASKRFLPRDAVRIVSALEIPIVAADRVVAVVELLTNKPAAPDEMLMLTLAQVSSELGRVYQRDQVTVALQEARAEAESSARAKASFLAAMSHEVRTPMNGVVGMVDLVMQTKLDDEQRLMLQTVKDSGHALITVINDILDFSKIEAGRLEIEQAEFSIAKVLEDVAMSLAPAATQKHLTLITYADPRLPDVVLGDAVRVRQILSNLGSNAVKFSDHGAVRLKAVLQGDAVPGQVRVQLSVRDEGVSISPEVRERLFEEFQQADSSTTRRFGGTGLGLAICKRLTTLMGGEISVESEPGVGSEFLCTLPFAVTERRVRGRAMADLENLRVLVVAQSAELREACRGYLTHWKAEVEAVAKLRECLPQFHKAKKQGRPIDVIVIPESENMRQIVALRQGFIDAGLMPYPRFVVGRDARAKADGLFDLKEVTLLEVNPIRSAALLSAVAIAAGRASPEAMALDQPEPVAALAAPTVEEALAQGRLILVAEDHISNQQVIRRQLNRLGFACEIAEDGVQALKMWRAKKYALLLTDCHMPHMDGFGLTAEVRRAEKMTGGRAPIIAITANVLQGEAERCLAAGMDAFLPKPVEMKTLAHALDQWLGGKSAATVGGARADSSAQPVLDLTQMREVFGEIDEDVRKIYDTFLTSVRPLLSRFEEELTAARHSEARETIHKARGATANAGGKELAALMRAVETALVDKDYDEAMVRTRALQPAWERLTQAIAAI